MMYKFYPENGKYTFHALISQRKTGEFRYEWYLLKVVGSLSDGPSLAAIHEIKMSHEILLEIQGGYYDGLRFLVQPLALDNILFYIQPPACIPELATYRFVNAQIRHALLKAIEFSNVRSDYWQCAKCYCWRLYTDNGWRCCPNCGESWQQ